MSTLAFPKLQENHGAVGTASKSSLWFSLMMRTLFFIGFGLVFVGISFLAGYEHPMKAAERWWPFQAILANIATYAVLRYFLRKEGQSYGSLFGFRRSITGLDMKQFAWLLVVGFAVGGIPLYLFSYAILGSFVPPNLMFQPLPVWAAILALVLFPLTNGLVETPTYVGYALPRLKRATGSGRLAILFAGLALAFQHVALPLVLDVPYMLWRFAAFIPLGLAIGFIFSRTKRLLPIAMAHYVMDLQLAITLFVYSME
ncbi:CPBP family glutamic-type intramembrane protease [Paenibacillus soyae]|uniref:CPBP family glutamic-type intramembrane protease n=1 Tax=Paenibacillus soyae TaxID=2969249 RepID=A0A9X2SBK7_9BACL|nr:CPBP family intramembrane glutamic endopeptidase [Paenibacillus soyae]MCR2805748.1 CPBP family glutamic-type intramembrane protease [Paenibacillus soyae]